MPSPRSRRLIVGRIIVLVIGVVAVAGAIGVVAGRSARLPAPTDPALPDLMMGPIQEVSGGLAEFTLAPVIRVEATVVNRGAGDFLLAARRDFPWSDRWTVYQRTLEPDGSMSELATPADLIFTGAPHSHWHVRDMEAHQLERLDTGEILRGVIKQGFCPFDTDLYHPNLPGAPSSAVYVESQCEGPAWVTELTMGVSVGWGDKYPWHMIEQSIDITGIPEGTYRIREIADPHDWFEETDETNNETWVDVKLTFEGGIPSVQVVGRKD